MEFSSRNSRDSIHIVTIRQSSKRQKATTNIAQVRSGALGSREAHRCARRRSRTRARARNCGRVHSHVGRKFVRHAHDESSVSATNVFSLGEAVGNAHEGFFKMQPMMQLPQTALVLEAHRQAKFAQGLVSFVYHCFRWYCSRCLDFALRFLDDPPHPQRVLYTGFHDERVGFRQWEVGAVCG